MPQSSREFYIIVFGATSFVGELLCDYLNDQYGVGGRLKWGIAGRNPQKLASLASRLDADSLPRFTVEAADLPALTQLAASTGVICTTVGPYALFGSQVVAACAQTGTDYCDLTGEPQWMHRMIQAQEATAARTGARIVHNCGFDSIPSDLGVWFTQQQARKHFGEYCSEIRMAVKRIKGGASGGTVDSAINALDEARADPAVRKLMQNPYALCPPGQQSGVRQKNVMAPEFFPPARTWLAPFIMAGINTRVVHRSHALAGHPWGSDFRYDESMMMGSGFKGRLRATALAGGLAGMMGLLAVKPARKLLKTFVLPGAGEGPDMQARQTGLFDLRFFGRTASGKALQTRVTGDRDPGYGATCKMLGEAAVALAQDAGSSVGGGFPTPAHAFGGRLIERLVARAGMTFEVVDH